MFLSGWLGEDVKDRGGRNADAGVGEIEELG